MDLSKVLGWKTVSRALLLGTTMFILLHTVVLYSQEQHPTEQHLLEKISSAPPWYDRFFHYTAWPDEKKLIPLKEVPDVQYSYETLINEVMREGVLDKAWREKVVRVKAWIPERFFGKPLDAYLYQQEFEKGKLHICDTRPFLVIAFAGDRNRDFIHEPKVWLRDLVSKLFRLKLPEKLELRQDAKTGMYKGYTRFNQKFPASLNKEKVAELYLTHDGPSSFTLSYTVAEHAFIFQFQKATVPGCVLDTRYPLFQEVDAKPSAIDIALEKIDKLKEPTKEDIPQLVELLSKLPKGPMFERYLKNPYKHRRLIDAKIGLLKMLTKALMTVDECDVGSIPLIKEAIKAENYIHQPDKNPMRWHVLHLKEAAVDALYRIRSDEAAMLHFEILNREKDPSDRRSLLGELGKYKIFRDRLEKMYEEAKAESRHITRYEMYEKLREEISQERPVSLDVTEGRASVDGVPLQEDRTKILILFIPLVITLFMFGGIFVLLRKKKVLSRSK